MPVRFPPGRPETVDEADPHRVGALHDDNRDRVSRVLGRPRGLHALQRHDHRYLTANQLGDQAWQPIVVAFPPSVLDCDVLAIDIAGIGQPLLEIGQTSARLVSRCQVNKSDHRQRRLLCVRRDRPCRRRAAKRDDEFSSLDVNCHATVPWGSCNGEDDITPSTTLADLLTPPVVANPFSTMRASLRR